MSKKSLRRDDYLVESLDPFDTIFGKIYLNKELIEKQLVSLEAANEMIPIYQKCDKIVLKMSRMSEVFKSIELKECFNEWMDLQFKLQELWNFPRNANYFKDYELPHCKCPKMDNNDSLGTKYRIITEGCIYHG